MGQQQLLLIIIGLIIVAVAIAAGMTLFGAHSVSTNRDALISEMSHLANNAYAYRATIKPMGGGGGSYMGYIIPVSLQTTDDGSFTAEPSPQAVTLTGLSSLGYGTVKVVLDSVGQLQSFTYSGEFE